MYTRRPADQPHGLAAASVLDLRRTVHLGGIDGSSHGVMSFAAAAVRVSNASGAAASGTGTVVAASAVSATRRRVRPARIHGYRPRSGSP